MEKAKILELVRSLVADGIFQGAGEMISLEPEKSAKKGAQFASEISLLELKIRRPSGEMDTIPIVIKLQFSNPEVTTHDLVANFNNEVAMYKDILPALNIRNKKRYPHVYYCYSNGDNDFSKDILIMENLKTNGFTLGKHKVFLDFDHVSTALKSLGQFHSWSYECKRLNKEKFIGFQRKLIPPQRTDNVSEMIVFESMKKGVEPFLEKGIETNVLETFLKCIKKPQEFLEVIRKPDDVFSVIIHGDFNNNNLFFKYDEQGRPIDIAFFDFQFSQYSSPAIDLSFFLYMNTEKDLREEHWDDFLRIYWDAVKENTPEKVLLPKYEEFLKHFANHAVFGYFVASFFLPMMLTEDRLSLDEFAALSDEEKINHNSKQVDKHIQRNIDIVSHMLEHKYIQNFIALYDEHFSSCDLL